MNLVPLRGEYYAECNEVFRRVSDQSDRMLEAFQDLTGTHHGLRLLSVGAGVGLFEIPMLQNLGDTVLRFVGLDIDRHACEVLERNLMQTFPAGLEWQVLNEPFQDFQIEEHFDLVLFNHTFEYLDGDPAGWLAKARDLLDDNGRLVIFSPNRGGINKIYAEIATPHFSEDLVPHLIGLSYSKRIIEAECDISLFDEDSDHPDRIRLLSFMTQADCRQVPASRREEFIHYYQALRSPGQDSIPHPTTLFVIHK
jgi:SAM-dependent methyltransferase